MSVMSGKPQWRFGTIDWNRDTMVSDPVQGEFFTTEGVGCLADAVTREAIQNSLDARDPDSGNPVWVRFAIEEQLHLEHRELYPYAIGLAPHLVAKGNGLQDVPEMGSDPMRFLVVEDYETVGLTGDPDEQGLGSTGRRRNDFMYFWRIEGKSGKSEEERGRWGVGKTVFPASSRINTLWGVTRTADCDGPVMLGLCVLKSHRGSLDEGYKPHGHFAVYNEDSGFPLAIRSGDFIKGFCEKFGLRRESKPGLSIVVPYVDEEITGRALTDAVLRQYFYPIICGQLVVEIEEDGQRWILEANCLEAVLEDAGYRESSALADLESTFELARWSSSLPEEGYTQLVSPDGRRAPSWGASYMPFSEDDLEALRDAYREGGRLALRIPVSVEKLGGDPEASHFDVYLERDITADSGDLYFIRNGVTVTDACKHFTKPKGVRCLVVLDHGALASMVGDSENPAHTEWQARSPRFKGRYRDGDAYLRFVKGSPRMLVQHLSGLDEGVNESLLEQIFSLDAVAPPAPSSPGKKKPEVGPGPSERPRIELGRGTRALRIGRIAGGFSVVCAKSDDVALPQSATIEAALARRRGSAFANYSELDFDMRSSGSIEVEVSGARVQVQGSNYITLVDITRDMRVHVRGFDENRDLVVRAREAGAER